MIINKAPEAVKRFCEEMLTIINENKDKRKAMTIKERLKNESDIAIEIADAFVETVETFDWSTINIGVIDRSMFRLDQATTIDFMKIVMDKCGFHNLSTAELANDPLKSRIERAFWILSNVSDYKKGYLYEYVVSESDQNRDNPGWTLVFDVNQ